MGHDLPISKQRNGFTLIELLVVISIIAILAALLLPAMGLVKSSANQMICASNVRQLALCVQAYTSDNLGILPPSGFGAGGNFYTWDTSLLLNYAREIDNGLSASQITSAGNSRSVGIYKCPVATDLIQMSSWSIADYGLNGHICGANDQNNQGKAWKNTSMASVSGAADVYLMSDTAYINMGAKFKIKDFCSPDYYQVRASWMTNTLDFRHRGVAIMGFLDCHVAPMRSSDIAKGTFLGWYKGDPNAGDWKALYANPWGESAP